MPELSLENKQLRLSVDPETGLWTGLYAGKSKRSWLLQESDSKTGMPFVGASAIHAGAHVPLSYTAAGEGCLKGRSQRGGIETSLRLENDVLECECTLPDRRGPRSGWTLNFDHLDSGEVNIHQQLMPVSIMTSEALDWAYIIWQRAKDDFMITAVDGLSSGWRIDYSYGGHRMTGFELLSRADDVICPVERFPSGRLPTTTRLKFYLSFADSRQAALEKAFSLLNLAVLQPDMTACSVGNTVALKPFGPVAAVRHVSPSGESRTLDEAVSSIQLDAVGQHQLEVTAESGRMHISRLLAWGDWKGNADRAMELHRKHFQHECGAFSRILRSATLIPDGRQVAGYHFGDPEQSGSCNPGEFGGFSGWAMMLHQQMFGQDPELTKVISRYFDWALNRGREDKPRPGTVCQHPHTFGGREQAPYHLFEQICYCQYETWLIRQLSDTIRAGEAQLLLPMVKLVEHFIKDHTDETGLILNQGWAGEEDVDYSTVDCPLVHLLHAAETLRRNEHAFADDIFEFCRKNAEHLYHRGFDFPTEGEPCTEDGSIACQAWGLAAAYNHLPDADTKWIEMSESLVEFHSKLEMYGTDIRTDGSSLRFWESMYESDNYGPSINAGHAWTLWTACARWELYRATSAFRHLRQCWQHTMCAAHTFDERGASHPCYTPDIIPAPMHDDAWGDPAKKHEGRMTSASLGWGYPDTVSASGMYVYIVAAQIWYRTCGYDPVERFPINAIIEGQTLTPATPLPCTRIALAGLPEKPLIVLNLDRAALITLTIDGAADATLELQGAQDVERKSLTEWVFKAPEGSVIMGIQ